MSATIYTGDWIDVLRTLPSESVQCCVTSPPYWGLRDYGVAGQLGLERTPEEYVAKIVEGFREVRRVLRKDGTCWINLGDSYNGSGKGGQSEEKRSENWQPIYANKGNVAQGMKAKDLVGIPWLVAFALRADGWYLRQDIIWAKDNPMPESVTDRCTKSHEYIFLLTKSPRYFYDAEAVKELTSGTAHARGDGVNPKAKATGKNSRQCTDRDPIHLAGTRPKQNESFSGAVNQLVAFRNKRSVWNVATAPFPEAHFATFPPKLIEPCVKSGTSEVGCCSKCGKPWERVTAEIGTGEIHRLPAGMATHEGGHGSVHRDGREREVTTNEVMQTVTVRWEPLCECAAEVVPCTVLDPFNGAGTTGLVAQRFGRSYVGIELNPDYVGMAANRISQDAPLLNAPVVIA